MYHGHLRTSCTCRRRLCPSACSAPRSPRRRDPRASPHSTAAQTSILSRRDDVVVVARVTQRAQRGSTYLPSRREDPHPYRHVEMIYILTVTQRGSTSLPSRREDLHPCRHVERIYIPTVTQRGSTSLPSRREDLHP